jgi:2-polyprenyl-6-methoxyphenol hydroxylase-like FAD-dependent oxidoreductase
VQIRNDRPQVLVVGAGPTGLTAAMELSRLGIPVRIIDRASGRSATSRALAVQARTLELMEPRGVGAEMVRLGNPAYATTLYGRGRRLGAVRLDRIPSRFNYILLLAQAETERLLTAQLGAQGVRVERGLELVRIRQDAAAGRGAAGGSGGAGGVEVVLRTADGGEELARCAYLIDASGAHSAVRHELGLDFAGRQLVQSYLLGDLHLDGAIPPDELSIFMAREGFAALFPMTGRRFRVMATDPGGHAKDEAAPTLAELQRAYDHVSPLPVRLRDLVWSSRFRISSRHLSTLRAGNVFFGGDAAHIHSPAGGQGMNTGIQDMVNLCWKLALVLQGRAAPELLDTYQAERLPVIVKLVRATERATQLFNSSSWIAHQALSHLTPLALAAATVQAKATATVAEVASSYRTGPLAVPSTRAGDLRSGDRVPDLELSAGPDGGPARLHQLLDLAGLTLLSTAAELPASVRDAIRPWAGLVTVYPVTVAPPAAGSPGRDARIADSLRSDPALLLIRPDGHLAASAPLTRPGPLTSWLSRWCPPLASPSPPGLIPSGLPATSTTGMP